MIYVNCELWIQSILSIVNKPFLKVTSEDVFVAMSRSVSHPGKT